VFREIRQWPRIELVGLGVALVEVVTVEEEVDQDGRRELFIGYDSVVSTCCQFIATVGFSASRSHSRRSLRAAVAAT